jgi:hypothetical protein
MMRELVEQEALEADQVEQHESSRLPQNTYICCSVSDGAGDAIKASRNLTPDAVWCGAHLLQLVAGSLIARYNRVISRVRSLCSFVRMSTERREALLAVQSDANFRESPLLTDLLSLQSDSTEDECELSQSFAVDETSISS